MRRNSGGPTPDPRSVSARARPNRSLFDLDADQTLDGTPLGDEVSAESVHGRRLDAGGLDVDDSAVVDARIADLRRAGALEDDGEVGFDGLDVEEEDAGDQTPGRRRRAVQREAARRQNLPLRLVLGGGVVFVVSLLITAGGKGYRDLQIIQQREAEVSARIVAAEHRLEDIRHRIQLLREDPATLERLAREELGLVGPDDIVFVLPAPAADPLER